MADIVPLQQVIGELVGDGDLIALESFSHLIPMAAGHEIIRQGRRRLKLAPERSSARRPRPRRSSTCCAR